MALPGATGALLLGPALLAGCAAQARPEQLTAPDIASGYLVFNSGANSGGSDLPENAWLTSVQSVLVRHDAGTPQYAYLGKECLAEGLSPQPFSGRDDYDFVGVKGWDGNYCLRNGAHLTPQQEYTRIDDAVVRAGFEFEATCPQCEVTPLGFSELLEMLRTRPAGAVHKVFLSLGYAQGGVRYTMYTGCRYINFPHGRYKGEPYLQPIFGRVLFHDNERFRLAYGALHLTGSGLAGLQFKAMGTSGTGEAAGAQGFTDVFTVDPASIDAKFYHY